MTIVMMRRSRKMLKGVNIEDVPSKVIVTMARHNIIMLVVMMLQMIMHREQHHQNESRYQQGAD